MSYPIIARRRWLSNLELSTGHASYYITRNISGHLHCSFTIADCMEQATILDNHTPRHIALKKLKTISDFILKSIEYIKTGKEYTYKKNITVDKLITLGLLSQLCINVAPYHPYIGLTIISSSKKDPDAEITLHTTNLVESIDLNAHKVEMIDKLNVLLEVIAELQENLNKHNKKVINS